MDDVEVPEYFICPISLQIMKDPVTATTGITYDRASIQQWLFQSQNTICPVTNQPLPINSDLTPNHILRKLIQTWCTTNASKGIDRISTPKPSVTNLYVLNLLRELWLPNLQLKALQKLELLVAEREKNRQCLVDAGVAKAMVTFIITCYKNGQTTGLEQAVSILYFVIRSPPDQTRQLLIENDQIIDSLTWVLGTDLHNKAMKSHALILLRIIFIEKENSKVQERLELKFFKNIVRVLNEGISQQGIRAALYVMLGACPWGRNRSMMVEAGAVFELIEMELGLSENRTTELSFQVLLHLCCCADGRAQLLSHAAGVAVLTKRIMKVSPACDDRAISILLMICKFSGTDWVLQEMLRVGSVTRLCMVLQTNCASSLKEKVREILRRHNDVWKHSPCVEVLVLLTRYAT